MQNNTTNYTLKIDFDAKGLKRSVEETLNDIEKSGKETAANLNNSFNEADATFGQRLHATTKDFDLMKLSIDKIIEEAISLNKILSATTVITEQVAKALDEQDKAGEKTNKNFWQRTKEWMAKTKTGIDSNGQEKKNLDAYKSVSDNISSIMGTYSDAIKYEVTVLKEGLKETSAQLDELKAKKEKSAQNILSLNKELATSQKSLSQQGIYMTKAQRKEEEARAKQLMANIAAEKKAKQTLEDEERRLQAQKEEQKKTIAEKEKKQKKIELGQSMVKATANTAESVTKMLGLIWPLNLVMAAIVGGMGAAQIGIIGRQMAKLKDGGILSGPSHANGGMPILGSDIEVEGGEYVVNKTSTANNRALLDFINSSTSTVTAGDLVNRQGIPIAHATRPDTTFIRSSTVEERLLDAVEKINITPVVSVVDIIDTQKSITTVRDKAGY